jgi:catechol 2,3-dioxygenase-like lactoylglutathione lyase family enzyme
VGAVIALRRIHHVALRAADVNEAARRWSIQFGLTEAAREEGRVLLRCAYEPYSLELLAGEAGHDHTAFELARGLTLEAAAAALERECVAHRRVDGSLRLADPDGNGLELRPYAAPDDPRPPIARETTTLPAFRPRKLGHVNVLTADLEAMDAFYSRVLGVRLTDRLVGAGLWYHVNADHHVLALVAHEHAHFHHLAFELTDWGELRVAFDHLAQHGRWLVWGPLRHGLGQNLCGYVRVPEEECLVELYCDMEQLADDHRPRDWPDDVRSSNAWGILPPRSYFRFDEAAIESERLGLEARGVPLAQ